MESSNRRITILTVTAIDVLSGSNTFLGPLTWLVKGECVTIPCCSLVEVEVEDGFLVRTL